MAIFNNRFAQAVAEKGISFADIARRLGEKGYDRSRQAVAGWAKDGETMPKIEIIRELAIILDREPSWLVPHLVAGTNTAEGLPLLGKVAAGVWKEVGESQDAPSRRPIAHDPRYPIDSQYLLEVDGTSINKVASHGALLTCVDVAESGLQPRSGDLVIVERRRGALVETTAKRLRSVNGAPELWPESTDPGHQEPLLVKPAKSETIEIKAIVIWAANPIARGD